MPLKLRSYLPPLATPEAYSSARLLTKPVAPFDDLDDLLSQAMREAQTPTEYAARLARLSLKRNLDAVEILQMLFPVALLEEQGCAGRYSEIFGYLEQRSRTLPDLYTQYIRLYGQGQLLPNGIAVVFS